MRVISVASKIFLPASSVGIIIISVLFSKYDTWISDLFYSLTLFSIITAVDLMIFELSQPDFSYRNHLIFCLFPVSRLKILLFEIESFAKRAEFIAYFLSVLFYISFFYLGHNSNPVTLFKILFIYTLQFTYSVCSLFIIKSTLCYRNFTSVIKNSISLLISFSVTISILAEKSEIIKFLFLANPLSCGFLSYLEGNKYGMAGMLMISFFSLFLCMIIRNTFKQWPLCQKQ
jgi:hypothetical protein